MQFTTPIPFAEAIAKLAARKIVPSSADSLQWAGVPVALREGAFFSSRVESARVLQGMRDYLSDYLQVNRMGNGGLVAQGRAEFVADMRELAIREGLGKVDPVSYGHGPWGRGDIDSKNIGHRGQRHCALHTDSGHERVWCVSHGWSQCCRRSQRH
jgi:hypothetical protein